MSGYPRKHPTARWAMPRGPECDCGECSRRYVQSEEDLVSRAAYGQNSARGRYGVGSYSYEETTFDGQPALKRHRDGKLEFFYGNDIHADGFLEDHKGHGHAIIKNGKLIYKCPPGSSYPVVDLGG